MVIKPFGFLLLTMAALWLPLSAIAKAYKEKRTAAVTGSPAKLSILLLLNTSSGTQNTADGTVVLFDDAYSAAIADEDSYKFTNLDENIAINRNGTLLSIEGRPAIVSKDTVPLKLWQYTKTDYLLRFDASNFEPNVAAVLKDAFLNTETSIDLSVSALYSFNVSGAAAAASNRFSIIFYLLSVPANVTSQPADAIACPSGNAVFTAAAAGFYLNYQWQVSSNGGSNFSNVTDGALYTGANTRSLNLNGVTGAVNTYKYRVLINGSSPVSADTSVAATLKIANTWLGNSDNIYNNAANWACNSVPAAMDDVVISSSAATMPQLTTAQSVGSLTLQTSSVIDLNGQDFAVNGTISGAGAFKGSLTSSLTIGGTGSIAFTNGNNILKDLHVPNTANVSLGSDLSIAGVLDVAGTFALSGHTVTLKAGTEGGPNYPNTTTYPNTAIVGPVTGTITYGSTGKFIVERYIPSGTRAFRFISSPVNSQGTIKENWMENGSNAPGYGTHITGYGGSSNGFDPTITNNPSLFTYTNATQSWGYVANSAGTLHAGDAYRLFVRGDRTIDLYNSNPAATATILRATGTLQTGTFIYNSPFLNGAIGANRYNFVGNPYASPVRFSSLAKTNIAPSYWAWDPNIGTRGAYINYIYFTDGNGNFIFGFNNTSGTSKVNDTIQPEQAFFIQTTGAAPVLTFNETSKTFGTTPVFRTMSDIGKFSIQLILDTDTAGVKLADAALALFSPDFSRYIGSEDAVKFINPDENIAFMHNDTALSMEGRPLVGNADTLFIKLWQYRQKEYYLRTGAENLPPSLTAILKDNYLQTETQLDPAGSLIPFSLTSDSASFAGDRFIIVLEQHSVLPLKSIAVKAYQQNKGILVSWISTDQESIKNYEVERSHTAQDFQQVATLPVEPSSQGGNYKWFDETPFAGDNYYRVNAIYKSGSTYYSNIAKITGVKPERGITVFPDVSNSYVIHVHAVNLTKGKYKVQLYNSSGQQMYVGDWNYDGTSSEKSIQTNAPLTKGVYSLVISSGEEVFINKMIR